MAACLALTLGLSVGGCDSMFPISSDHLEPGTFRYQVDGRTFEGEAVFSRNEEFSFAATVSMETENLLSNSLRIGSDGLLNPTLRTNYRLESGYMLLGGGGHVLVSGTVRIDAIEGNLIRGVFQVSMRRQPFFGPSGRRVTVNGAFAVLRATEE
ncbi:hypothetical protein BH23BAC4_BH23BAC4_07110 [soil metagenome]